MHPPAPELGFFERYLTVRVLACIGAGIGVTLFVNWAIKPFSMALLGWNFIRHLFADWLLAGQHDSYIAALV